MVCQASYLLEFGNRGLRLTTIGGRARIFYVDTARHNADEFGIVPMDYMGFSVFNFPAPRKTKVNRDTHSFVRHTESYQKSESIFLMSF